MHEVFAIIFFAAWLCKRKAASGAKSLFGCFYPLHFPQTSYTFSHHYKNINKKCLAVFSGAMCFNPAENMPEKGCDLLPVLT